MDSCDCADHGWHGVGGEAENFFPRWEEKRRDRERGADHPWRNSAVPSVPLHEGVEEKETGQATNHSALLQRMINVKLILQEAKNIGLDALPGMKENVEVYEKQTLRGVLLSRQVRGIRPDKREVERTYKESIREMQIRAYLFDKEENAKQAEEEIRSGGDFDNLMKRLVAEGKAKGEREGAFLKEKDLLPEISEEISKMKEGAISSVLKVSAGSKGEPAFTILKFEGIRFSESPEARERASKEVLQKKRMEAMTKYAETLKKKYVRIRKKTLEALDYEAETPGLDNLLKDRARGSGNQGRKADPGCRSEPGDQTKILPWRRSGGVREKGEQGKAGRIERLADKKGADQGGLAQEDR